jgi:uncharacterized protein (TIGR03083 family)
VVRVDNRDTYLLVRGRLIALAAELDAAAAATPVPALPGWTVQDTLAHLAGVCADTLDGRLEGAPGPAWTARQVTERLGRTLAEVVEEWATRGPQLDARIGAPEGDRLRQVVFDAWSHEHDIRGAVDRPGERADSAAAFVASQLVLRFQRRWAAADRPSVRIVAPAGDWALGAGEPVATLRTSDFELARMLVGRRSRRQMLALPWTGDPAQVVDHLHTFELPERDLAE